LSKLADNGGLELKRVRPDTHEARCCETGRNLAARGRRRLCRGAGAPRLGDDRDPSAGPHEAMERLQPFVRLVPPAHVVHGQDLVERLRQRRQMFGRTETKNYAPCTHGLRVASRRLPHVEELGEARNTTSTRESARRVSSDV